MAMSRRLRASTSPPSWKAWSMTIRTPARRSLSSTAFAGTVQTKPHALRRILSNFIDNALKIRRFGGDQAREAGRRHRHHRVGSRPRHSRRSAGRSDAALLPARTIAKPGDRRHRSRPRHRSAIGDCDRRIDPPLQQGRWRVGGGSRHFLTMAAPIFGADLYLTMSASFAATWRYNSADFRNIADTSARQIKPRQTCRARRDTTKE